MTRSRVVIDRAGMRQAQERLADAGFARAGEEALRIARSEVPVDTGRLRDAMWAAVWSEGRLMWSEGPVPTDPPTAGTGIEALVGNGLDYARHVHDGTVDTPQHPFLAAALAVLRSRAADIIGGANRR